MKKIVLISACLILLSATAMSQFSFYLIDNFEDGDITSSPRWWQFGEIEVSIVPNPVAADKDLIAESCGMFSLNMSGSTNDYYVGGIGSDIGVDANDFSRFQIDVYGNQPGGAILKIELFDDDNNNYSIEQNPDNDYNPFFDDKLEAKIFIQGQGFTRTSIPFSAFVDANPGVGDDIWNPGQDNGSGGLMKIQLVAITEQQHGSLDFNIDNLLLTY